ncbi:MAG: hydroxyacid dehydrogenase [Acidobacteriota bacterium]|nr:hydroxyacid dehydrogenase [Acidobacteriota bacterium]
MKILLLESIHEDARELLAGVGEVVMAERVDADYLVTAIADASAALTRGYGRLPRAVLAAGRGLRCVARCGVGTDNIDVEAATELGLPVIYAPGSTTATVAEHAVMLMLAVARRAARLDREVKAGNWAVRERVGLGTELNGKTLAVLGLGDIGRRIAELGQAFGMRIIYWSRTSRDDRFEFAERDDVLRAADVLSINVALTGETRGLLSRDALALMKPSAIVVNTARGDVIDEAALHDALASGRLAGAGLDVIAGDSPRQNNPLWTLDTVVITPHVAALTDVTYRAMCLSSAGQVARILRGDAPDARFVRNPSVLKDE